MVQLPVMCFSVSKDRGDTWSVSKPIGFAGHCPYLHRTSDGIVILGYRRPWEFEESSTDLRYSLDECRTWSDNVLIDNGAVALDPSDGQLGGRFGIDRVL